MASGLGGLNKSPNGVVIGLAQLALPDPHTREALWAQTEKVVSMVAKARRSNPGMDLIVFPEYSLHGLSMSTAPDIMCSLDGPEVAALVRPAGITASGAVSRSWKPTPTATRSTAV